MTQDNSDDLSIFPPDSYSDWVAKWWVWLNSIPKKDNPIYDETGENCCRDQSGPAWFLVGTLSNQAQRRCEIPAGKGLVVPLITTEIPLPTGPQKDESIKDITEAAKSQMDQVTDIEFHITLGKLRDLKMSRVLTRPYDVTYMPDGIYEARLPTLKVDIPTETKAVSDGFWVFSERLSAGDYKFTFHGKSPTFENTVIYELIVR